MAEELLPRGDVLAYLAKYGYLNDVPTGARGDVPAPLVEEALADFQLFNGLPVTGHLDHRTAHVFRQPRCGLPDKPPAARAAPGQCRWPANPVTYATSIHFPQLSEADNIKAYDIAASQWMAVCGIQLKRIGTQDANIFARTGQGQADQLDGAGGTLAWSELPCQQSMSQRLRQVYDLAENWNLKMAVAVICHELGHAIGMEHQPAGNLLAPFYDPNLTTPQAGDIAVVQKLYGPPVITGTPGTPPPTTPPTSGGVVVTGTIIINGVPYLLVPKT